MRKPQKLVLDNGAYRVPLKAETMKLKDLKRLANWAYRACMWKQDQKDKSSRRANENK